MNLFKFIKSLDFWKVVLLVVALLIILFSVSSGYIVKTRWGIITRENAQEKVNKNTTKIKTQTNYSKDMKTSVMFDLGELYECILKQYIRDNNLSVPYSSIEKDVRYYKLIVIAMSDNCEDITIDRYIHNNDLYRYANKNDWSVFKQNVINLYIRVGKELITNYYDDSKVIMPLREWMTRGGKDLTIIVSKNTDKLLEDLKIESNIYHIQDNGGSKNNLSGL